MFQGRVTLLPGTELWPVCFNKHQQNENAFSRNIHGASIFPQCIPVSNTVNIVSSVSFCFQDANVYGTRKGILKKIRACEHEQASTQPFLRAIRRLNFASTFDFQIGWDHLIPLFLFLRNNWLKKYRYEMENHYKHCRTLDPKLGKRKKVSFVIAPK